MNVPLATPADDPVRAGFRLDRTHRIAALIAYLLTLIVALVSVWPMWTWLSAALAFAPRGDVLIDRLDLVVLKELVQFDRASTFGLVRAAMTTGVAVALLLNPLIAGGVIGLLTGSGAGRASHRFFDIGVRFYGRFFRALIYVGLAAIIVGAVWWGLATAVADALSERGLERAEFAVYALRLVGFGLVLVFFGAVLDLARIHLVTADSRHVLVSCADALRLALRRFGTLVRIGIAFLVLLLVVAVIALVARAFLPGGGWGWVMVAVALQQAVAYTRLRLRVASIAALVVLARPKAAVATSASVDARFAEYDRDEDASGVVR